MARESAEVIAVGVNCLPPADAGPLVAAAARGGGQAVVVYPNSGEDWDAAARSWRTGSRLGRGGRLGRRRCSLVGGCCRVTPSEIAALAAEI